MTSSRGPDTGAGDDYGSMVTFTAVDANGDCRKKVAAAIAAVGKNIVYLVKNIHGRGAAPTAN